MSRGVFGHGQLRLYLLSLLAEEPRHGYEIIRGLGERFGGTYTPSAGTVYPRLAKLEDEGLVVKTSQGRKSVYSITEAGRAELRDRRDEVDELDDDVSDSVRRLAEGVRAGVDEAMRALQAELASAADEARRGARGTRPVGDPGASRDDGGRVRDAARDVERALREFQHRLRGELRAHAPDKQTAHEALRVLRRGLDRTRDEVREVLRR